MQDPQPGATVAPVRGSQFLGAAQALTGIAAVLLGLTYGIGASLRAGELREAGVDVRDGLAVIPIEQLLTRGIDALLDPRNVMALVALALLAVFAAATGWAARQRVEGQRKRLEARFADAVAELPPGDLQGEARERFEAELKARRTWQHERLEDYEKLLAAAPRRVEAWFAALAGLLLLVLVLGFLPWVYALSVVVGVALLGLLAVMMWRTGTPPSSVALFIGLLLVVAFGIMVQGQVDPRRPATIKLALREPAFGVSAPFTDDATRRSLSGRLVAVTDQAWYIASDKRKSSSEMLSIERSDATAAMTTGVDREFDSVAEIVWQAVF